MDILLELLMTLIVVSVSLNVHMNTYLLEAHLTTELRNLQSRGWRGSSFTLHYCGCFWQLHRQFVAVEIYWIGTCLIWLVFSNSESHRPSFSSFRIAVQLLQQKLLQEAWRVSGLLKWSHRGPYQFVLAIEPKMVDLGYFEHIFTTHVLFCIILTNCKDRLAIWVLLKYRSVNDLF